MTNFASKNDGTYITCYHEDPDCTVMKRDAREITTEYIEYHELKPCWKCAGGERTINDNPELKYQNASINEENDPINRIYD